MDKIACHYNCLGSGIQIKCHIIHFGVPKILAFLKPIPEVKISLYIFKVNGHTFIGDNSAIYFPV